MENEIEENYPKMALITTSNWFVAPDGQLYQAVFGTVDRIIGNKMRIGNMLIELSEIKYSIITDKVHLGSIVSTSEFEGKRHKTRLDSRIYNADQ